MWPYTDEEYDLFFGNKEHPTVDEVAKAVDEWIAAYNAARKMDDEAA